MSVSRTFPFNWHDFQYQIHMILWQITRLPDFTILCNPIAQLVKRQTFIAKVVGSSSALDS